MRSNLNSDWYLHLSVIFEGGGGGDGEGLKCGCPCNFVSWMTYSYYENENRGQILLIYACKISLKGPMT